MSDDPGHNYHCQRYMQLPIETRAWLERMNADSIRAFNEYCQTPEEVRKWLVSRRPDDVLEWDALIKSFRTAGNASRVIKWLIIAFAGTLITVTTLWERFAKFFLGKG